jgi:hypothetical protein
MIASAVTIPTIAATKEQVHDRHHRVRPDRAVPRRDGAALGAEVSLADFARAS